MTATAITSLGEVTEVPEKARRRTYTVEYKLQIVKEAESCKGPGEIGALLRREGRVDECLEALTSICSLVQPAAQQTAEVAHAVAAIVRRLGFVAERQEARAPLDVAAFFTRPRVKIQGIRQVEDEAALLGHVYIFGVMHHAWFVQVEEQDGDQVAVDDPYDRLEEFQQLDADAGRFQTVEVPGFPGDYVLAIYPAGA